MAKPLELDTAVAPRLAPRAFSPLAPRDYNVFTVLKKTGEVTSMKIRELATT
jgi:hypothetical protein